VKKQIRFPTLIDCTDIVTDERDVIRSHGTAPERHARLIRRSVPLCIVAGNTGRDKILPCVVTSPGKREDMVNGKSDIAAAAVLTSVRIPSKNVLPREDDLLVGHPDVH
jgi:hypothetical protein